MKNEIVVPAYLIFKDGVVKPDFIKIIDEFTALLEKEMEVRGQLSDETKEKLKSSIEKLKIQYGND
jgi:hypothetical protein